MVADVHSPRILLYKENVMAMICLDQREKDTTHLNCDINSLYEREALQWYVEDIKSETTRYLIKQASNKYLGGQSQDTSVLPDSSSIIILTLVGPNSLTAARYL